jgi:hypothetical protein
MPATRSLTLVLAALGHVAALTAQGPYYVDGMLGVDGVGYGTSPAQPYRTITHAIAQAGAPATGTLTIKIQGGRVYSPATNGETFPLAPPPGVTLEGVPGSGGLLPDLTPPAGAIGVQLDPNVSYGANSALLRNMMVSSGDCGVRAGSTPGGMHVVGIENCHFHGQASYGIRFDGQGGDDRLSMRDATFAGASVGVSAVRSVGPPLQASLERCRFDGLSVAFGAGPLPGSWSSIGVVALISMQHCSFVLCGIGVRVLEMPCTATFDACRFIDCGRGVDLDSTDSGHPNFSVHMDNSTFAGCLMGLRMHNWSGDNNAVLVDSTFSQCETGVDGLVLQLASNIFDLRDCSFLDNQTGLRIFPGDAWVSYCSVTRCRFLRGDTGLQMLDWYTSGGTIQLEVSHSLFAGQSASSIQWQWSSGWIDGHDARIDSSTFADNLVALDALPEVAGWGLGSRVAQTIFAGNGTDIIHWQHPGWPSLLSCIECLTDGPTLPGATNQVLTDAQLLRPSYKLAPTSPCIDAATWTGPVGTDYEGDPRPSPGAVGAPARLDLGADEFVPTGSLRPYGTPGFTSFGMTPRIGTTSSTASIGSTFDVDLSAATSPGALAILALGFREAAPPLLFDLAEVGIAGSLWLEPEIFQAPIAASPTGAASFTQAIPNFAWLVGLPVYFQWLVVAPLEGMVTSDGLRVTLGT